MRVTLIVSVVMQLRLVALIWCILSISVFTGCGGLSLSKEAKYPAKDIILIIPNTPGGGNDLTVRALIPGMKKSLGFDVLPYNKPGAQGAHAASEVMNAKPDGYTLYFNSQTLLLMPYGGSPDVNIERFQPVAQVVEDTPAIIVRADSRYKDLSALLDDAKANPQKLRVAHAGIGALWHLAALQFSKDSGVEFKYVAYLTGTSGMQMLSALIEGEVDLCVISPSESKPLIDSGKVRVLAIMGERRHSVVPDVPTCKEVGVNSTFSVWRGVFTTSGVSQEKLALLERAVKEAVNTEEFQEFARNNGLPVKFSDSREFKEFIYKQRDQYSNLMVEINKK
jgi:tripartite-type tricarboxylate transporter receptor subunit TctC